MGSAASKSLAAKLTIHDEEAIEAEQLGDVQVVDSRQNTYRDVQMGVAPVLAKGELWRDPLFETDTALGRCHLENLGSIVWIRPKEFIDNPRMFGDTISRYDVLQGDLCDSWFLAAVAGVADFPERIRELMVDKEYNPDSHNYNGVVHVRLWQFQGWIDVYIDDLLPMRKVGEDLIPILARTPEDDVMWVTFLTKAFAKIHGGFRNFGKSDIDSKMKPMLNAGYAFACLTGGANTRHISTDKLSDAELSDLFSYCTKCIKDGHFCTSRVPDDATTRRGLNPGQVYSIANTTTVQGISLLNIRSTHSEESGKWIGSWSPKSNEWRSLEPGVLEPAGEGESWISAQDFWKHFRGIRVCKFRPYFSASYHQHLDLRALLYSEWRGSSQVGRNLHNRFKNPKFEITIPELEGSTKTPVIFELVQHQRFHPELKMTSMRMDIYTLDKRLDKHEVVVFTDITSMRSYQYHQVIEYHYNLTSGVYLLVPHTQTSIPGQCCVRVHTVQPFTYRFLGSLGAPMLRNYQSSSSSKNNIQDVISVHKELYFPGKWLSGVNSGGGVECNTFYSNPQHVLNLQDFCRLRITLLQKVSLPHHPMSYVVFKIKGDTKLPLTVNSREDLKTLSKLPTGLSYDNTSTLSLRPGRYVVMPYTQNSGQDKTYCLIVGDVSEIEITTESYNTI